MYGSPVTSYAQEDLAHATAVRQGGQDPAARLPQLHLGAAAKRLGFSVGAAKPTTADSFHSKVYRSCVANSVKHRNDLTMNRMECLRQYTRNVVPCTNEANNTTHIPDNSIVRHAVGANEGSL
jgi:hypothetical protein